jgi:hypothetical protein
VTEGGIAETKSVERFSARGPGNGHDRSFLQRYVDHGLPPGGNP